MSAVYAVVVLLLACLSPAAGQGGDGNTKFTVPGNGRTYTIAQVFQFAPIAYFHPEESYHPVSIATLTAASALLQLNTTNPNPYTPILSQGAVTPAVLGQPQYSAVADDTASGSYFLNVSSAAHAGTPLAGRQVDTTRVPMYFSVQTLTPGTVGNIANKDALVINSYFLYEHNRHTARSLSRYDHTSRDCICSCAPASPLLFFSPTQVQLQRRSSHPLHHTRRLS